MNKHLVAKAIYRLARSIVADECLHLLSQPCKSHDIQKHVLYDKITAVTNRLKRNGGYFTDEQDKERTLNFIQENSKVFQGPYKGRTSFAKGTITFNEPSGCIIAYVAASEVDKTYNEASMFDANSTGVDVNGLLAEGFVYYFDNIGLSAVDEIEYVKKYNVYKSKNLKYVNGMATCYYEPSGYSRVWERKCRSISE